MKCPKSDWIGHWLLGTLSEGDRAELLDHSHRCEECGPEVALLGSLHGAFASKEPSVGAIETILRECSAAIPRRRIVRWRTVAAIYGIAAAALLFLAFHTYKALDSIRVINAERELLEAEVSVRSLGVIVGLRRDSKIQDNRSLVEACREFPFGLGSVRDGILYDPWGRAYILEGRDGGFAFWSSGANGLDERGAGDDIAYEGSWSS